MQNTDTSSAIKNPRLAIHHKNGCSAFVRARSNLFRDSLAEHAQTFGAFMDWESMRLAFLQSSKLSVMKYTR